MVHDERVGTILGQRYRLERVIGRGGMGVIFEARHTLTQRSVAIKLMNREHLDNPEAVSRFLREAQLVAELKHPNVVDVLDMGDDPDHGVFIALERLEGDTLSRLFAREGTLSFARAAELLVPAMRAVAFAHSHGVVHRDLKPENIFVHRDATGREVPKVLDFGIAKVLEGERASRLTLTGVLLGTPTHMSPEQCDAIPENLGPAADVWSMGVTWYEALSGSLPFEGVTPMATLIAVRFAKYAPLRARRPSVPPSIAAVIDHALTRDPWKRYADMGAFLDALELAGRDPRPTFSLVDSHRTHAPPRPRSHAVAWLATALAVALFAGVLHGWALFTSANAMASDPPSRIRLAARPLPLVPPPVAPSRVEPAATARPATQTVTRATSATLPRLGLSRVRTGAVTRPARTSPRRALPVGDGPLTDYDLVL